MITGLVNENEMARQKKLRGLTGFSDLTAPSAPPEAEAATEGSTTQGGDDAGDETTQNAGAFNAAALGDEAPRRKGNQWQMFSAVPSDDQIVALIDMAVKSAWEQEYGPVESYGEM